MTNAEKFKTAEERSDAFRAFCKGRACGRCPIRVFGEVDCKFYWLDLEAKDDVENCPYCGSTCEAKRDANVVKCSNCHYTSAQGWKMEDAIAAHNRLARAVMEAAKKEEVVAE